jgi:hypothetical protein
VPGTEHGLRTKQEVISVVTGKPIVSNEVFPTRTVVGNTLVYEGIPGAPEPEPFTYWPDEGVPGFTIEPMSEVMKSALDNADPFTRVGFEFEMLKNRFESCIRGAASTVIKVVNSFDDRLRILEEKVK